MPTIAVGGERFDCDLVIFDMDGTLVDEVTRFRSLATARARALRELVGEDAVALWSRASGVDVDAGEIDMDGPLARAPRREDLAVATTALYLSGYRWREAKRLAEQAYKMADEIQTSTYDVSLLPGVEDTLRHMRGTGLRLAIATNGGCVGAVEIMRGIGVYELFDAIVGADDVKNAKPAPDMVLLACERCGCRPSVAVYVGDQPEDMMAGRRAAVKAVIAVRSRFVPAAEIEGLSDAVINSVGDIHAS